MLSFKIKIKFITSQFTLCSGLISLRPAFTCSPKTWAQLLERRSSGGPTTLRKAAAPRCSMPSMLELVDAH